MITVGGGVCIADNIVDFQDIRQIRIDPTADELLCVRPPFVPDDTPSGSHHLPKDSMERLYVNVLTPALIAASIPSSA
jgi:hypothetical protein